MKRLLIALTAASLSATPAVAASKADNAQPGQGEQTRRQSARIPFANTVGIRDWRPDGRNAVYIEDVHRNWYRADLFAPAPELPFVTFIGIDAGPTGTLDKFGAIYVDGQRYTFRDFVEVPDPTQARTGENEAE